MHLPHRGHILTNTHPGKKAGFSPFFIVGALLRGPEIIILFSGQMQLSFGNIHPKNEPIVGGLRERKYRQVPRTVREAPPVAILKHFRGEPFPNHLVTQDATLLAVFHPFLPGEGNVQLPGDKARRRMLKLLLPLNPPGGHGPGDELGQKKVVDHALLIPFI